MPNICTKYKKDLSDNFYEPVNSADLVTEKSLGLVKEWLQKEPSEENRYKCVRVCEELQECKKKVDETIDEFVDRFERRYKLGTATNKGAYITGEISAFMVLGKAKIMDMQRMFVLTKMNLSDAYKMFSAMCRELKLDLGHGTG